MRRLRTVWKRLSPAIRRAGKDIAAAGARLTLICVAFSFGYALADRLLTRLGIAEAIVAGSIVLAIGAGWIVTVRTGDHVTHLGHQHEDDQHSIWMLVRQARELGRDLRRQKALTAHLVAQLEGLGVAPTIPAPVPGRWVVEQDELAGSDR